jgi:putative transcriptional regulator
MTKKSKYKSDLSEALHTSATTLHQAGALSKATMRNFDARHLVIPSTIEPGQIKRIRLTNHVSQPVFARYLNHE